MAFSMFMCTTGLRICMYCSSIMNILCILRHTWLTSGMKDSTSNTGYSWQADGTEIGFDTDSNWNDNGKNQPGDKIAYKFNRKK